MLNVLPMKEGRLVLMVGNADGRGSSPTFNIKHQLKADGFRFMTTGWPSWRRTLNAEGFDIRKFFNSSSWACSADGVELRVCAEDEKILERYLAQHGLLHLLQ
jgi:hypothetical protein